MISGLNVGLAAWYAAGVSGVFALFQSGDLYVVHPWWSLRSVVMSWLLTAIGGILGPVAWGLFLAVAFLSRS